MLTKNKMAEALRSNDQDAQDGRTTVEALNELGALPVDAMYCAEQRALRLVLVARDRAFDPATERVVVLTVEEQQLQCRLAAAWIDGLACALKATYGDRASVGFDRNVVGALEALVEAKASDEKAAVQALRNVVAVLDGDGGHAQERESVQQTRDRACERAAQLVHAVPTPQNVSFRNAAPDADLISIYCGDVMVQVSREPDGSVQVAAFDQPNYIPLTPTLTLGQETT